ncbi:MAG TPA: hypothetical protein VGG65_08925 [Thermoanaerobaculia bacterium]|jgi:hypothetical protein
MRSRTSPRHAFAVPAVLFLLASAVPAASPSRKSPFVEITGEGTVATAPRETVHKNGRRFLEFEIRLATARAAGVQPSGADRGLALDTAGRVRVVHDLSCGGAAVTLTVGDRIEIAGEYVHVPKGGDLIHFTHPADGTCGAGGRHPSGYLRKAAAPVGLSKPKPAALVPDQAYTGPPPPAQDRPYAAIIGAKEKGASEADLLAKVARDNVAYALTTPEIQNLRAAGVSRTVIEAMLRSGHRATPVP